MKKSSTIFLQIVIVLIGFGVLAFMLFEPNIEGRNANATLFQVYFNDPFLVCAYIASIPFFVALRQAFKVLGYVGENKTFSPAVVKALWTIKYCAMSLVGFVLLGEAYLFIIQRTKDDIAGGVFMGLLMIVVFGISASVAGMLEKTLQSAVDIKSENDLTV